MSSHVLNYLLTCWQCNTNSICESDQTFFRFSCVSLVDKTKLVEYVWTAATGKMQAKEAFYWSLQLVYRQVQDTRSISSWPSPFGCRVHAVSLFHTNRWQSYGIYSCLTWYNGETVIQVGSHTSSYPCEMAVLQLCVRGLLAFPLKKHPLSERESSHFANDSYIARYETTLEMRLVSISAAKVFLCKETSNTNKQTNKQTNK